MLLQVLFYVLGGPWEFNGCVLRSVGGDALSADSWGQILVNRCQIGGLGGGEMCGMHAVLLRGNAKGKFFGCTFEFAGEDGGCGLACQKQSSAEVRNSTLRVRCVIVVRQRPTG